jgi:hypothetical protein
MRKVIFYSAFLLPIFVWNSGVAQLPASQETHHKIVFENQDVRVLDGHVPAHDTTPAHVHSTNGVVVFLSNSRLAIQPVGGQAVVSTVHPGDMKYVNYGDKPVTHIVWTDGPGALHFLVVELKRGGRGEPCPQSTDQALQFQWEQKGVRAYRLDMTRAGAIKLPGSECSYFFIDVSGQMEARSAEDKRALQAGDFVFFPAKAAVGIMGSGRGILLELE